MGDPGDKTRYCAAVLCFRGVLLMLCYFHGGPWLRCMQSEKGQSRVGRGELLQEQQGTRHLSQFGGRYAEGRILGGEDMGIHRIPRDSGLFPAPEVTRPTLLRLSSGCSWPGFSESA